MYAIRSYANAGRILVGRVPTGMHVHHELGIPVGVGGGIDTHPPGAAAQQADEYLALGRGELAGIFHDSVEDFVAQASEVVGFPVVACSRGEQGIKGLLPGHIGHGSQVLAMGLTETAQRGDETFPLGRVTAIEDGHHDHLLAMHLRWQERQRRCLAQYSY